MRFNSFSKNIQSPKKLNSAQPSSQNSFTINPAYSHRKLVFEDFTIKDFSNITASKEVSVDNTYQNLCLRYNSSNEEEFSKQSDQDTEESTSVLWGCPADWRTGKSKEGMEIENCTSGGLMHANGCNDQFSLSRSPSPKKRNHKDSPHFRTFDQEILQTPMKTRFMMEEKERRPLADFINLSKSKSQEQIARLTNDFEVLEVIGKGSFGKVLRCRHKLDKNEYAVKETFRKFIGKYRVYGLNEIQALASLTAIEENTNVVRYYNSWIEDEKLYLVMEYCPMSLKEESLKKSYFSEAELKKILRDVCLGLNYLHRNDIVHLDIKPENILISKSKTYKLGDMGQSALAKLRLDDVEEGDARYLAPELLNSSEGDLKKADIFSLGMTLFELATGYQIPPNGPEWHDLRNEKLDILDQNDYLSPSFKKLIKLMLKRNPAQRPSAQELLTNFLPDKVNLELKWERIERNLLKDAKNSLESTLEKRARDVRKRRKSF